MSSGLQNEPEQNRAVFIEDTVEFDVAITRKDANGVSQPVSLTSASIWCTLKTSLADPDPGLGQLTLVSSACGVITITSASGGAIHVKILPAATSALTQSTMVYYSVKLKELDAVETTVAHGRIYFQLGATRAP